MSLDLYQRIKIEEAEQLEADVEALWHQLFGMDNEIKFGYNNQKGVHKALVDADKLKELLKVYKKHEEIRKNAEHVAKYWREPIM